MYENLMHDKDGSTNENGKNAVYWVTLGQVAQHTEKTKTGSLLNISFKAGKWMD